MNYSHADEKASAIIISGLLRKVEDNSPVFQRLAEQHDIFVCTNRSELIRLPYLGSVRSIRYVEDDPYHAMQEQVLLSIPEGKKLFQWQKLSLAFSDIVKVEHERGKVYDHIYKLRTDLCLDESLTFPADPTDHDILFMQGDLVFGGHRQAFARVADFFFPAMLAYFGNNTYQKIHVDKLDACDFDAGKFYQLKWPATLFPYKWRKTPSREEIQSIVLSNIERIRQYDDHSVKPYFRKVSFKNRLFRSQSSFLHYVLSKDLTVKRFSSLRMRLMADRHMPLAPALEPQNP